MVARRIQRAAFILSTQFLNLAPLADAIMGDHCLMQKNLAYI
jgi:hypothetical protein